MPCVPNLVSFVFYTIQLHILIFTSLLVTNIYLFECSYVVATSVIRPSGEYRETRFVNIIRLRLMLHINHLGALLKPVTRQLVGTSAEELYELKW